MRWRDLAPCGACGKKGVYESDRIGPVWEVRCRYCGARRSNHRQLPPSYRGLEAEAAALTSADQPEGR